MRNPHRGVAGSAATRELTRALRALVDERARLGTATPDEEAALRVADALDQDFRALALRAAGEHHRRELIRQLTEHYEITEGAVELWFGWQVADLSRILHSRSPPG
jgi:hypothetical protein